MTLRNKESCQETFQDLVVQSFVNITKLLVKDTLSLLADIKSSLQNSFLKICQSKAPHIFWQNKQCVAYNTFEILTCC